MTRERVLKLPVLEIFGPTFQGEGRAIGQKTMFVRTAGCDYHCDWCDSAFTWDGSEKPTRMTADEVIAELDKLGSYDYVFVKSLNVTLNLAMDYDFVIQTPLMWLDKAETWELAYQLGAFDYVREKTLTCYNGIIGSGCGDCPACHLRQHGLDVYLSQKGED